MTKRVEPAGSPLWSGCATIDGLNSAAPSIANSWVKYAPISRRRCAESGSPVGHAVRRPGRRWRPRWRDVAVPVREGVVTPRRAPSSTSASESSRTRSSTAVGARDARAPAAPGRAGRAGSRRGWGRVAARRRCAAPTSASSRHRAAAGARRARACCSVDSQASVDSAPWFCVDRPVLEAVVAAAGDVVVHGERRRRCRRRTRRGTGRAPRSQRVVAGRVVRRAHASASAATSMGCWSKPGRGRRADRARRPGRPTGGRRGSAGRASQPQQREAVARDAAASRAGPSTIIASGSTALA